MKARSVRSGRREKPSLREAMKAWLLGVVVPVLSGILLYGTASLLLPRTADSVSVTVVQCATVQPLQDLGNDFECQGTTVFRRSFTDEATVSAVHATLDGLPEEVGLFANTNCNAGSLCDPRHVYRIDMLWHGTVVRSYATSNSGLYWSVRTLGLELLAPGGPTTLQDLVRLTGMPLARNGVP